MDPHELHEMTEQAARRQEKGLGLTTAVFAVLLAIATMLAHRNHTKEAVLATRAADQWSYYQAKNIRRHVYAADRLLAQAQGAAGAKADAALLGLYQHEITKLPAVRAEAERLEAATARAERRADYFDISEIFFEFAVVLCSIALLSEQTLFWKASFAGAAIGIVIAVIALSI